MKTVRWTVFNKQYFVWVSKSNYKFAPSKTSHCDVLEIYLAAYRTKEGRSCSPLLVTLAKRGFGVAVSHLLLRFGGYALCSSRLSAEAQEGISRSAERDQRAPRHLETSPAGLSWTSFSRRLRRLSVPIVSLVNQNLSTLSAKNAPSYGECVFLINQAIFSKSLPAPLNPAALRYARSFLRSWTPERRR